MHVLGYALHSTLEDVMVFVPRPGGEQPPGQVVHIDMRLGFVPVDDLRESLEAHGEHLPRVDAELDELQL